MSKRNIAASLGMGATAAGERIRRGRRPGLTWPLPEEVTEKSLEIRLFSPQWRPGSGGRSRTGLRCTASCAGDLNGTMANRWNYS